MTVFFSVLRYKTLSLLDSWHKFNLESITKGSTVDTVPLKKRLQIQMCKLALSSIFFLGTFVTVMSYM